MPDDLTSAFLLRRPLLQHVAKSLADEIAEWLADEVIIGETCFKVMSTDTFVELAPLHPSPLVNVPGQVFGFVQVGAVADATRIEAKLGELLTVHECRWLNSEPGRPPVLHFECFIPPHVMP